MDSIVKFEIQRFSPPALVFQFSFTASNFICIPHPFTDRRFFLIICQAGTQTSENTKNTVSEISLTVTYFFGISGLYSSGVLLDQGSLLRTYEKWVYL